MVMRHPASERFHALLKEMGDLHDKKQADYGREDDPFANVRATEEWGQPAWVGALIRGTDKLRRLQKLALGGSLVNEAARDSFLDLAVYALIGLVLYDEQHAPSTPLPTQPKVVVEIPHGTVFATPPQVVMPPMAVAR